MAETHPEAHMFPKLNKGMLMTMPSLSSPIPRGVVFQANPGSISRSITPSTGGSKPVRFTGVPQEEISFSLTIDATKYLAADKADAKNSGIYPQLSALELMVYPSALRIAVDTVRSLAGVTEISAPEVPLTLFVWGKRVLPVLITKLAITEKKYDVNLNPIQAEVKVTLKVMTYNDVAILSPSYGLYAAQHVLKETMVIKEAVPAIDAWIAAES